MCLTEDFTGFTAYKFSTHFVQINVELKHFHLNFHFAQGVSTINSICFTVLFWEASGVIISQIT